MHNVSLGLTIWKMYAYFFNRNISLNISINPLKFGMPVDSIHMEGSVSQTFNLGRVGSQENIFQVFLIGTDMLVFM